MPHPYVQAVAAKQGRPVAAVDADWKRAEGLATSQYGGKTKAKNPSKFYAIVTHIFQNIAGAHGPKAALEGIELPYPVTEEAATAASKLLHELWESSYPDYEWTAWLKNQEDGMWEAALRYMWHKRLSGVAESSLLLEMPWLPTPSNGTYDPEFEKHGTNREAFLGHVTKMFSGEELHDKHHNPSAATPEEGHLHLKSRGDKLRFLASMREDPIVFAMAKKKFGVSGSELEKHAMVVIDRTSPPGIGEDVAQRMRMCRWSHATGPFA